MRSPPLWGSAPGWRARLYAAWCVLLGRSVMFNVWLAPGSTLVFDGNAHIIRGGIRGGVLFKGADA